MHMDISEEHGTARIYRKRLRPKKGTPVLCEPAQSKCTWTCHKTNYANMCRKKAEAQARDIRFVPTCAVAMHIDMPLEKNYARILKEKAGAQDRENPAGQSRRNRNAHGHVTRAFLRENYRKMVAPQERECTWTCGRACAHGHATRALLCENLKGKRLEVQPSSLT
jgi:hypothetical protein